MLRCANIRVTKQVTEDDARILLTRLKSSGCNAVYLNLWWYVYVPNGSIDLHRPPQGWYPQWLIYPDLGQDPQHPWSETTDQARVYAIAKMAQEMGFVVGLKPMLDISYRGWRGWLAIPVSLRKAFLKDYKERFLATYVPMVKELNLDLVIGTELFYISATLGPEFWLNIVNWLRWKGVKSPLTYAANWGWANPGDQSEYNRLLPLWQSTKIDYAGIDAYWPMVGVRHEGPIAIDLLAEPNPYNIGWNRRWEDMNGVPGLWCPPIDDDIEDFMLAIGKPVMFTEIGVPNNELALVEPFNGERWPALPVDYTLSSMFWQATRQRWYGHPYIKGVAVWEAGYGSFVSSVHNVVDTPIADIVFKA
jgi:hypothetical protein